jgi:hypothetical protein
LHHRAHGYQVRHPPALGHVVRMTDPMPHGRAFPTHVAALGHDGLLDEGAFPGALGEGRPAGLPPGNGFLYHGRRGGASGDQPELPDPAAPGRAGGLS